MPSRPSTDLPLAALSLAVLLVVSGCLGGGFAPSAPTADPSTDVPTTSAPTSDTATETAPTADDTESSTATTRPCSLDAEANLTVRKPTTLTAETARQVAETVESRYQSARVEDHSYYNHHVRVSGDVESTADGYRVVLRGELEYDRRGGENATVTHVHRPYRVTYRVTDRAVVRRGEAGTTGTVVCR
ncbi:RodZ family helix-turn-helix domain-containing protein [Halorussus salinisoli]|uniref:hypothetical protein n=1 Tax=Halorussus salinisoli TaxID=2558242 RepID=UPI0010C17796|nr:hypothetical protein [Halorussus salinisoli]